METTLHGTAIPTYIEALPLEVFEIPTHAENVGRVLFDLGWPRRKIVDRLQLRLEYYLEAGGIYREPDGTILPIHAHIIEEEFSKDINGYAQTNETDYKWLSDFPKRCAGEGIKQAPSEVIRKRLQILDLAIRTPPLGYAI